MHASRRRRCAAGVAPGHPLRPACSSPFIAAAHQTISALCFLRYGLYPEAPSRRLYYATSIFGFLAVTLYTISIGIDFTLLFLEGETRERPVNKSVVCIGLLMAAFLGLPGNVVVVMRAWFLHPHAMGGGPHGQFHPDYIGRDPTGAHRRRSTMTQSTMATSQGMRTLRPSEAVLQLPPMEMNLVNHKLAQRPSDSNLTTERENML